MKITYLNSSIRNALWWLHGLSEQSSPPFVVCRPMQRVRNKHWVAGTFSYSSRLCPVLPQFSGKRLQFWCDECVVAIINQGHSKAPCIMDLVRFLILISMKHNFFVRADHVPGVSNGIADALSRFQAQRFRDLAPHADQHPCTNRQCVQSAIGGSSVVMTIVHFIGPEF